MKKKLVLLLAAVFLVGSVMLIGCGDEEPAADEEPEENGEVEEVEEEETAGEKFEYEITGIEPGAGIMINTEDALENYDSLADYSLIDSSDAAMTAALREAIADEEWIVVTGWAPHWKFAEWDLKFLEDPQKEYGEEEHVSAIVREGLEDYAPYAYELLDEFIVNDEEIGEVMAMIDESGDPEGSAEEWVADNPDIVSEWVPEGADGEGQEIELAYVNWACATAKSYTVQEILETEMGYEVDLTMADAGPIWADIAEGDKDGMVCAWLPATQGSYYDEFIDDLVDLGPVYEGARIGLVVPEYVDIDSIDEM